MLMLKVSEYVKKERARSIFLPDLVFILAGLVLIFACYFHTPQIVAFWNCGMQKTEELSNNTTNAFNNFWDSVAENSRQLSVSSWGAYSKVFKSINFSTVGSVDSAEIFTNKNTTPVIVNPVTPTTSKTPIVKDCGTGSAPKLDKIDENSVTLACLGDSALACENAKGVLNSDFFPTNFEINKSNSGACSFKLSYSKDSTLTDITGKKLASQYISCPVDIVKAIDDTNPAAVHFSGPDKKDSSKYANQIYLYGTLGIFVENNLDQNKIDSLGCSGGYIDEAIASYGNPKGSQ